MKIFNAKVFRIEVQKKKEKKNLEIQEMDLHMTTDHLAQ